MTSAVLNTANGVFDLASTNLLWLTFYIGYWLASCIEMSMACNTATGVVSHPGLLPHDDDEGDASGG